MISSNKRVTIKSWFDTSEYEISETNKEIEVSRVLSWAKDYTTFPMGNVVVKHDFAAPNRVRYATFKNNKVELFADAYYEHCDDKGAIIDLPEDDESPEFEGVMMFIQDWLNEAVDAVEIDEINKRIKELEALC